MNISVTLSTWSSNLEERKRLKLAKIKDRMRKQAEKDLIKEQNRAKVSK